LPDWSDDDFEPYAKRHYPAYWLKVDLPRKVQHAKMLAKLTGAETPLATAVELDRSRGAVELTVIAPDHRRLLSIIAGGCAASGANFVAAHFFTSVDGLALDAIFLSRAFDFDEDEMRRARRIADFIAKALRGEVIVSDAVKARARQHQPSAAFSIAPEVVVDNSLSNVYTVIEVSGLDREGLLFDLTDSISKLNLNIASAHIVTFGERAVDTFYVTDLTGLKVSNAARQGAIRRALTEVFAPREPEKEKEAAREPARPAGRRKPAES